MERILPVSHTPNDYDVDYIKLHIREDNAVRTEHVPLNDMIEVLANTPVYPRYRTYTGTINLGNPITVEGTLFCVELTVADEAFATAEGEETQATEVGVKFDMMGNPTTFVINDGSFKYTSIPVSGDTIEIIPVYDVGLGVYDEADTPFTAGTATYKIITAEF